MRRLLPPAIAALSVLVVIGVPLAMAANQQFNLAPGDTLTVTCINRLTVSNVNARQAQLACSADATPVQSDGNTG